VSLDANRLHSDICSITQQYYAVLHWLASLRHLMCLTSIIIPVAISILLNAIIGMVKQ
jgi:hypothetical protein